MGVDLNKLKSSHEADKANRQGGQRHGSSKELEWTRRALGLHRWAVSKLIAALHFNRGAHDDGCMFYEGEKCTCQVGRLIRQIKSKLRGM